METHNHTPWTPMHIMETFTYIGHTASDWRQRSIALYEHPTDPALLISFGTTYDRTMQVIAIEPRSAWATALDYIAHGKVYRSQ